MCNRDLIMNCLRSTQYSHVTAQALQKICSSQHSLFSILVDIKFLIVSTVICFCRSQTHLKNKNIPGADKLEAIYIKRL